MDVVIIYYNGNKQVNLVLIIEVIFTQFIVATQLVRKTVGY